MITYSVYNFSNVTNRSHYFKWIHKIKNILRINGSKGNWDTHTFSNKTWLAKTVKQKLTDMFLNDCNSKVESDTKIIQA